MNEINQTGESFNEETYWKVRKKTMDIVKDFAGVVRPGITEIEGHQVLDEIMNDYKVEKKWHPNKFRIGANTLKSFSEKSDLEIVLGEDDIFFVDIGPVLDGHEGDYGDTFITGDGEEFKHLKTSVKKVFDETKKAWRDEGLSGRNLYIRAEEVSQSLGVRLNLKMDGHRLGDFPHALFFKGSLEEIEESILPNLWVLEILIQNKEGTHGAFFEDILKL